MAVLVAILGIVNTLTVSITDRRRELGVLQAVGGLRKQIRHTIWMEAATRRRRRRAAGARARRGAPVLHPGDHARATIAGMRLDYTLPVRDRAGAVARSCWPRRSSRRSGRPRPRCAARWWRRWNMSRAMPSCCAADPAMRAGRAGRAADRGRGRRSARARKSQRYEGTLEVIDARRQDVSDKRWTYSRIGSHGDEQDACSASPRPAEVKGVALLIVNHPGPRVGPVDVDARRSAATGASRCRTARTRFFGTDFSFEDLEERDVDQYDYTLLGEETIDGARSAGRSSRGRRRAKLAVHALRIVWVRKDNYVLARVENFSDGTLVRRLDYRGLENVQGIWTARELEMHDLRAQQPHSAEAREARVQRAARRTTTSRCRRCGANQ